MSNRVWRIVTPNAKFVYFFVSVILMAMVYAALAVALGDLAAILASVLLSALVVGCAARVFRDPDVEPYEAPREPWRMTARPASGFVFGGIFVAQACWIAVNVSQEPYAWAFLLGAAVDVLIATMFFRSSWRLRMMHR